MVSVGLVRMATVARCGEAPRFAAAGGATDQVLLGALSRDIGVRLRSVVLAAFVAAVASLLCGATPAQAATIEVNTAVDENGAGAACSLREAITAVNTGSNGVGGCVASGAYGSNDQITFAVGTNGVPILLTNGQIAITRGLQIVGNGAASTIVDGQKGTPFKTRVLVISSGIAVSISRLTIQNAESPGLGGGINNAGTLTVTDSTLSGNSATSGGGIFNNRGTMTVANSTVSGNSAASGGGITNFGGGIVNDVNTLTVINSTISGNSASIGGGIANDVSALTVINSTLSGNSSSDSGGGIWNSVGAVTVINSTLSGNSALSDGGSIFNETGTLTVANSTLSGNSSTGVGGIANSGTASLRAAVLDTGASGANCGGIASTSLGSNVADDTSCSLTATGDQQVAEGGILLGPLADNGGPTQTHALLAGSPAIDVVQGLCTSDGLPGGAAIVTDQRGRTRLPGPRCDAGAFEFTRGTVSFSAPAYSVGEGEASVTITVMRTGGSEGSVGATVSTANGTAVAPADYTGATPTVSFADGDTTSKTVSIAVIDDPLKEPNETVTLTLGQPTGGVDIRPQSSAVLTIIDNDPTPTVSVGNVRQAEGNSGTTPLTLTATLTNPSSQQITVQYATTDGSAKAGSDYTATTGILTFAPGATSQPISVPVQGDTLAESDETLTVTLSNPTNAALGVSQAIGTIQNDDVTVACGPRPRVTQTLVAGGGALAVAVEASPLNTAANNSMQQIRFGTFQNATVTLNGQSVTSGQTVTLPPKTYGVDLTVRRVTPGQATTVPFTVSDACGSWDSFVGGGAGAGF